MLFGALGQLPEYATDSLDAIRAWMALVVGSVHSLWQLTLCDSGGLGQHWSLTQFITVSMVIFFIYFWSPRAADIV